MKRTMTMLVLVVCLALGTSRVGAESYRHILTDGPMSFSWTVVDRAIQIKITGKTTGWVGVGFNPYSMMKGANFIVGFVKDGKVSVEDHIGNAERNHTSDTASGGQNNVSSAAGSEKDGVTEISFSIPLDSLDPNDRALDVAGKTTVLLSMGGARDSFRSGHTFKAIHRVTLSTGLSEKVK